MTIAISRPNGWLAASFDGIRGQLASFQTTVEGYCARRAAYNRTLSELNGLTDRDLADIGIFRADIHQVALDEISREQSNEA